MLRDPISTRDKLLKVLYEWRQETTSESVHVSELSARIGVDVATVQALIQDLLETGYVKTGTPSDLSQIATWVKITKSGRDYLREKAIVV